MKRQRIFLIVTAVVLVGAVSGLVFALSQRDKAGKENTIESENKNTIENENKSESKSESEGQNKSESEGENKSEGAGENKNEAEIKIEYELPEVPEGSVFLACDYSQIELRLLAHLSGDEHLIAAFNEGEDFHAETAARVFGVAVDEVTPQLRSRAKAVNFGIVYGQQAFGLASSLKIPRGVDTGSRLRLSGKGGGGLGTDPYADDRNESVLRLAEGRRFCGRVFRSSFQDVGARPRRGAHARQGGQKRDHRCVQSGRLRPS